MVVKNTCAKWLICNDYTPQGVVVIVADVVEINISTEDSAVVKR